MCLTSTIHSTIEMGGAIHDASKEISPTTPTSPFTAKETYVKTPQNRIITGRMNTAESREVRLAAIMFIDLCYERSA